MMADVCGTDGTAARQLDEIEAMENVLGAANVTVDDDLRERLANAVVASESDTTQVLDTVGYVRLDCKSDIINGYVQLVLPPRYPLEAAQVSIGCSAMTAKQARLMNQQLSLIAAEHAEGGEECLLELLMEFENMLKTLNETNIDPHSLACTPLNNNRNGAKPIMRACLHIDHMNDSITYVKKVKGWIAELGLTGRMLYKMRSKPVNASSGGTKVTPKGRAENVLLMLEGEAKPISNFLTRLRTFKLTSQDRREKKSTVIWESSGQEGCTKMRILDHFEALLYDSFTDLEVKWGSSRLSEILPFSEVRTYFFKSS